MGRLGRSTQNKKNMKDFRNDKKNGKVYAYILDAIELDDYGYNSESITDSEKVKAVYQIFVDEYYHFRKNISRVAAFEDYLRGLPSSISVTFDNYSIEQQGRAWGYCQTPRSAALFVNSWWSVLAQRFLEMYDGMKA